MSERPSSEVRSHERLAERRRTRRIRIRIASGILFCIVLAAILHGFWQSPVRISRVVVYGADQSFAALATSTMQGSYFGIIPRDSTFFFPAPSIRSGIIAEHPDIAAVSIFRNGLTGLSIRVDYRVPIARWCGLAPTEGVDEYCYLFDANGFVFAAADVVATSTQIVNNFALYAPLEGETLEPLRASLAHAEKLPAAFDFARQFAALGAPVVRIIVTGDEVSDVLASGTRITYVLGNEQNAFTALTSSRTNFNLTDGSVEYIDLRFDGKVYVKKGEPPK